MGRPTYADATAHPPGPSAASTPGAPSVTQLLSLHGILSLRPRTSLRPLTIMNWTHDWDNGDNKAGGTEESKDDDLNVDGTAETMLDDVPAVKDTTAAALTDTVHGDDDAASVGSGSPPLLSSPDSTVPLTGPAPPPLDTFILDSSTSIHYTAGPTPLPTPPIGDLPATATNGMDTLQRAVLDHLTKLDRQRISIGEKYGALHDLLVKAQTKFDASAIEQRVQSAVGAHSAELIELIANAEVAIDVNMTTSQPCTPPQNQPSAKR
jgi:hypothetical protein